MKSAYAIQKPLQRVTPSQAAGRSGSAIEYIACSVTPVGLAQPRPALISCDHTAERTHSVRYLPLLLVLLTIPLGVELGLAYPFAGGLLSGGALLASAVGSAIGFRPIVRY